MRPDRAAAHPEMVRAGKEALSEGTIPAANGHGPDDGEELRRGENAFRINGSEFPGSRVVLSHY